MTQDEIANIRKADYAWLTSATAMKLCEALETAMKLCDALEAAQREREAAVMAERQACAEVCANEAEFWKSHLPKSAATNCMACILARNGTPASPTSSKGDDA